MHGKVIKVNKTMPYPHLPPLYKVEDIDGKNNHNARKTKKLPIVIKR